MDIRAKKRSLRRAAVEAILALDPTQRRVEQSALIDRLRALPTYDSAQTLLLYVTAFPEELDTGPLLNDALASGKTLLCPRVDRARRCLQLHHVRDLDADLVPGVLGIPEPRPDAAIVEPEQVDWALVPGLLFDELCYRLGRGAGHYDRLLPQLRPDAPRWALAFECQWVRALPIEPHDVPLDGVLLPSKAIERSASPIQP